MRKHFYIFLIFMVSTLLISCSNNPSSKSREITVEEKIKEAKTIDEVRTLLNGTTWHYTENLSTSEIEGWLKVSFKENNYIAYSANPADGKWTETGNGTYEIGEGRYSNTGEKYIYVKWKGDLKVKHLTVPCEYTLSSNNFQLMVTSSFMDGISRMQYGYYDASTYKKNGFMTFGDYTWN